MYGRRSSGVHDTARLKSGRGDAQHRATTKSDQRCSPSPPYLQVFDCGRTVGNAHARIRLGGSLVGCGISRCKKLVTNVLRHNTAGQGSKRDGRGKRWRCVMLETEGESVRGEGKRTVPTAEIVVQGKDVCRFAREVGEAGGCTRR
ncbi:uncharacterized protein SPSK_06719 [Sporothrix schenckii 1099-18]|uniref:Uncharacterized protein n=1 Tax=Sporothrix schenckii 1099-18 TaxID=1397361 RepID=A0A0F2MIZ8_SPOSC|nr:uncharacterized protein SPSK_06719 [Sporothrix schenckii 1099-18]KJR89592.1 hypothetical protein SPSK_06719 [Sporothrix schenckii 1099-18]